MALTGMPRCGAAQAAARAWKNRFRIALLACGLALPSGAAAPGLRAAQLDPDAAGAGLVALGEYLFRSPLLSADGTVSCRTCHVPRLGFSGDRPLAVGVAGHVNARRAPALLGLRNVAPLRWDGRAADLATQVAMPLESPEMAVDWPSALRRLEDDREIGGLLQAAGVPGLGRTAVVAALAAYVSSLDAGRSRFDRLYYGRDETALTSQEAWGLRLFSRKARCGSCHLLDGRAAPFTDGAFHVTGIGYRDGTFADLGRAGVTGAPADAGAFKTPGLRGVALRPYLMHDGSMTSLRQAVEHYNVAGNESVPNLDERLKPLFLTPDEVAAIVAFLDALTPEGADK
jgi:cytochrome c peroxidase